MKLKKSTKIMFIIWGISIFVNLFAKLCHPAVDFYISHIFPYISSFWSHTSNIFPFSLGEWMIVAGIVLVIGGLLSLVAFMIFAKGKRKKIAGIYGHVYGWILTWLFAVVTSRFFVLYQGTQLSQRVDTEIPTDDVLKVYQLLVDGANRESALIARDENGYFIMTDDLMSNAKECMTKLSQTYPQYQGWYPNAKPIYHSYFFSQQGLLGIYYPFSMEANYNPVVYPVNLPVTICHEFTHLKGNIFEDEAGYYGFLACMTSESADFRYSAYVSALEWFDPSFGDDTAAWDEFYAINRQILPEVNQDLYTFVPDDYWKEHKEKEEFIPTDVVSQTADIVMDTTLKINGIPEGKHSYHGMTALLLHHYLEGDTP